MVTSPSLEYQLLQERFAEFGASLPPPPPGAVQEPTTINIIETTRARGFMPSVHAIRYAILGMLLLTFLAFKSAWLGNC